MQRDTEEGGGGLMCCCHAGSKVLFVMALVMSLLWYLYWAIMQPVELDIKGLTNWYFFVRFHLRQVYEVYGAISFIQKWCPLLVLVMFGMDRVGMLCKPFSKLPQAVYTVIVLYNTLLFVYLLVAGHKISSLFLVVLPVQLTFFLNRFLWLVLLVPTIGTALYCMRPQSRCYTSNTNKSSNSPRLKRCPIKALLCVVVIVVLHVGVGFTVRVLAYWGCQPCDSHELPHKPALVAHRGCGFTAPENTALAFEEAAKVPQMVALETDVQISYDGVPFLLHDPHLIRMTNIVEACPSVDPLMNATLLNFSSGDCPLGDLKTRGLDSVSGGDQQFKEQKLITLAQFLEIAKVAGKSVVFDIWKPPVTHPYHSSYINVTLDAVISSKIDPIKVWWLMKEGRWGVQERYPGMVHLTKTEETDFEEFKEEHIQRINDDWTTPLSTMRKYQAANILLNMYVVQSPFLFNYAWCIGVQSVTTDNCWEFSHIQDCHLYQTCRELRDIVDHLLMPLTITFLLCSLSCIWTFKTRLIDSHRHHKANQSALTMAACTSLLK